MGIGGGLALTDIDFRAQRRREFLGAFVTQTSEGQERYLRFASGLLSLGFGLFLAYHIAIVDGLLTGHPAATPLQ